ncbi:MAG TPA: LLM class flavin-dependent oxidoreductase [Candidatus Sulfomarinibacteraceae bacterium]|nr:LLM class flavin-dependent oxidoreductase [Candidatus Sulfomarinibacteraceae bacterium]
MIQLSIAFQSDKRLATYGALAELVERYGFDTITVYEDLMFQPAWQPLLLMAQHTKRVHLGPAVVNPYLRHPAIIAGEIALLNEAAQGRAYLGVGRGAFLQTLHLEQEAPITRVRETVEMVQRLLRGDRTPYEGRVFQATEEAYLRWEPPYREIPLLIGTWGPRMGALAGRVADEVKIGGCWNPDFVPLMRQYVARGAREAQRDPQEVGICVGAVTVIDEDRAAAEALARREVAMYLPVVLRLDPTLQVAEQEAAAVVAAAERGDADAAATAISTETLRRLACFGTPEDVVAQVEALAAAGATRIEFGTPHGRDEAAAIRLLGERVLPYFEKEV